MIPIQQKFIKFNHNKGGNTKEYIIIHDTGNYSPTANAMAHYNFFNGGDRKSSAHYFVDKDNIVQLVKDEDRSWSCGDGRNKYGIGNHNTISIEICVNDPKGLDQATKHSIDLTVYLMKKYNIPIDRVVRHFDASRKMCPNFMKDNNWKKWYEFKTLVLAQYKGGYKNMTEDQVKKIVAEAMKPSSKGEPATHWADEKRDFLNNNGVSIKEKRYNDVPTRGELFSVAAEIVKLIKN